MTSRIDLPGGGWADIKAPDELTNRERKLLRRHAMGAFTLRDKFAAAGFDAGPGGAIPEEMAEKIGAALTADDLDLLDAAQSVFIVVYTAAWSLDRPLPDMGTVDDLPGPLYDALAKATAALGDGHLDTAPSPDPAGPTVPSGGSAAA